LAAQASCGGQVGAPSSGSFAEYRATSADGDPHTVRFAALGTELREGTRNFWFEIRTQLPGGHAEVLQVLVPGFPYHPSALLEAVRQLPTGLPTKLTPDQLARSREKLPALLQAVVDACTGASLVGTETVKVAAGSIAAEHYRNASQGWDIWVDGGIPFGIVKLTGGADRRSLELTGSGRDAKSSFTGLSKPSGAQGGS